MVPAYFLPATAPSTGIRASRNSFHRLDIFNGQVIAVEPKEEANGRKTGAFIAMIQRGCFTWRAREMRHDALP